MSWSQRASFHEQLRVMLQAGLPIGDAVRQAGLSAGGEYAAQAEAWSRKLGSGQSLSEIMAAADMPALDVALMRAGEKSGHLPELCSDISTHYRHAIRLRNMVISQLVYPVILVHVTLLAATIVLVFILNYPAWLIAAAPLGLWAVIGLLWLIWQWLPARTKAQLALSKGCGFVLWPLLAANTCSVLRAALSAGMLAPDALELSAGACGNHILGDRLRRAGADVRHGRLPDVTSALQTSGLPDLVIDLCRSGEKAGALDQNLGQATTVMRESFRMRSEWSARLACSFIYGGAMVGAVVVVVGFYMGYLGFINELMDDIE
jgi:general secretion pathway protein F